MPYQAPANFTTSSKHTPGRPDTLAIPVERLVTVPISRGLSCGVNASRTWLIPTNALSKTFWRLSGSMFIGSFCFGLRIFKFRLYLGFRFSLGFSFSFSFRLQFGFGFRLRLGFSGIKNLFPNLALRLIPVLNCSTVPAALLLVEFIGSLADLRCQVGRCLDLGFSFVLLFQKFVDAFFERGQIISDAPRHFLSIRGEFDSADQVRRGLEPDVDFSREGFVERILYRRALLRRQIKRAAHERGGRCCLEGVGEACFRLAVHLSQAASEHLAQAFFQTRRGEIRQRLSRDGKHFLLGPATDSLA